MTTETSNNSDLRSGAAKAGPDFDGRACVTRCTRPGRALGEGFTLPPYARTQNASRTVPVGRACGQSLYSEVRQAVTQRGRAVVRPRASVRTARHRGSAPADLDALVECCVRFSDFVADTDGQIAAIDLNPVFVLPLGCGVRIADALIETKQHTGGKA